MNKVVRHGARSGYCGNGQGNNAPIGPEKSSCTCGASADENWDASEKSCTTVNRVALQDLSRARAAELVRRAFPAASDRACAEDAARFLGYSERQILNWLGCHNSMPFDAVFAIGCRVGVFVVMEVMTMGQGRNQVLSRIVQGVRRVIT